MCVCASVWPVQGGNSGAEPETDSKLTCVPGCCYHLSCLSTRTNGLLFFDQTPPSHPLCLSLSLSPPFSPFLQCFDGQGHSGKCMAFWTGRRLFPVEVTGREVSVLVGHAVQRSFC